MGEYVLYYIDYIKYIINYVCLHETCVTAVRDLFTIFAIFVGGLWALKKYRDYRENKHWIQFDIYANTIKLQNQIKPWICYSSEDIHHVRQLDQYAHAVELLFKFTNKGNTRVKIYNIRGKISTMPPPGKDVEISQEDGHLGLCRIFTSGNIVPIKTKYYYIEPHVEQTITFLSVIPKPRELIRVTGEFTLANKRHFPNMAKFVSEAGICKKTKKEAKQRSLLDKLRRKLRPRLLPHTAEKTYRVDNDGFIIQEST
jgi:hypothetical protein